MEMLNDTIAAIATALSDSGIGIVRISGNQALEIADSILRTKSGKKFIHTAKSHTIHYGFVVENKVEPESMKIIDEVMVSVFHAPKSYTKEDVVEINCHGGVLVTKKGVGASTSCRCQIGSARRIYKKSLFQWKN
jgi:tRNA modification GTPase